MIFKLIDQVVYSSDADLNFFGFANGSIDRIIMKNKYQNKKLSFQSSSCFAKQEFLLNIFEVL